MLNTSVYSPQLRQNFRVEIAFPPGFRNLRPPFPAAILNDAQNQWTNRGSYNGWHTDSIASELFRKGRIQPLILIGLYSPNDRDRVFAPPPNGQVDHFADFLADTLLPQMRRRLPISKYASDIAVIGASFASNASICVGLHRPDAISLVAGLSAAPHFGKPLGQILAEHHRLPMKKLYIDCGTRWAYDNPTAFGGDSTAFNRSLMSIARSRLPRGRFLGLIAQGHYHNEEFWRKRIGRILTFLFGAR